MHKDDPRVVELIGLAMDAQFRRHVPEQDLPQVRLVVNVRARALRRAIQHFIEDPLADFVLGRELEPGSTGLVGRQGDSDEVDIVLMPPEMRADKVTVPPEEPAQTEEEPSEEE